MALPAGTWTTDTVHSSVTYAIKHNKLTLFRSGFSEYEVTLEVGEDGAASLNGDVTVESFTISNEQFVQHLKSEEFFDTAKFPKITFASTEVGQHDDHLHITGDLTIHGVTKSVSGTAAFTGPVEGAFGGTRVGVQVTYTVDRRDFGITWQVPLAGGGDYLGNDVELALQLELVKA
ncbi:YceI family protein [Patulibacter minatonensis]|uniref:YceI family protein n=1 Tax=Patulibacter minatonensis TaxID=298163 RepID=UPI00047A836D|nr:YceI family protein [Patulibacter minatonensis]